MAARPVVSWEPFRGGLVSLIRLHSALLCKVFDREGFRVASNAERLTEAGQEGHEPALAVSGSRTAPTWELTVVVCTASSSRRVHTPAAISTR